MQIIQWFIVMTTLLSYCHGSHEFTNNNGFILGHRQPGDELIEHREELARGSADYSLSYSRTYVGNNQHLLTQLQVQDLGHGATAALIAGGPGHSFASLGFTVFRRSQMRFNVTLYGKLPPYRKIIR